VPHQTSELRGALTKSRIAKRLLDHFPYAANFRCSATGSAAFSMEK
jgi:hypothetical protein